LPKDLTIGIDELIPDPKNARRHSSKNIGAIESSIRAFGPARSIVIDGNGVVRAGNGTLEAAKRAGVKNVRIVHSTGEELVAVVRDDLSDIQAAAYALADNRTTDMSEWDIKELNLAIEELSLQGMNLETFGFEPFINSPVIQSPYVSHVGLKHPDQESPKTEEKQANDSESEWRSMPEFNQKEDPVYRSMIVHFANNQDFTEFCNLLRLKVTDRTKFTWFPDRERDSRKLKGYKSDEP